MRRKFKYCLKRCQVKMAWQPNNSYNMSRVKPLDETNLNIFQINWKSKTLCRLYHNGDVTYRTFRRVYIMNRRNMEDTLGAMERRLDNIMFRSMFAPSVFYGRRMVSSGKVLVNGEKVRKPSHQVSDGDIVQVVPYFVEKSQGFTKNPFFKLWAFIPPYLEVNHNIQSVCFLRKPQYKEIPTPYPKRMVDNMAAFFRRR